MFNIKCSLPRIDLQKARFTIHVGSIRCSSSLALDKDNYCWLFFLQYHQTYLKTLFTDIN